MSWQASVQATLESLCSLRAQFIADQAAGNLKPTYSVGGHSYAWNDYARYLGEEIDRCMRQLSQGEPFEIVSQGQ